MYAAIGTAAGILTGGLAYIALGMGAGTLIDREEDRKRKNTGMKKIDYTYQVDVAETRQ